MQSFLADESTAPHIFRMVVPTQKRPRVLCRWTQTPLYHRTSSISLSSHPSSWCMMGSSHHWCLQNQPSALHRQAPFACRRNACVAHFSFLLFCPFSPFCLSLWVLLCCCVNRAWKAKNLCSVGLYKGRKVRNTERLASKVLGIKRFLIDSIKLLL